VHDVGHKAVDGDPELRVIEIGPEGTEDREGDVPVQAELVDCWGDGAWRVIGSLPVDRLW
jgi:hypothetical protein